MTELLVLELVEKGLVSDQMVLTVGYDVENLSDPARKKAYRGAVTVDRYGRSVPKHAHGTVNLPEKTSSTREIMEAVVGLYDRIVNSNLLIRRVNITANQVVSETMSRASENFEQLDLFTDYDVLEEKKQEEMRQKEREKRMQKAMISLKNRYGKNAVLKGTNLQEGATTIQRNGQIGGHKA
jgi:DNA polymerase V